MAIRAYAIMSFPLGVLLLADCLLAHFLIRGNGSFGAIPLAWKIATLALFALITVIGSVAKWIVIDRRAAQIKHGANFFSVIEAMYGGRWFNLSAPFILCMAATSLFFVRIGHPWLIASVVSIFMGPFCNIVASLFDRNEYLYTGWYMTIAGLASLFFIEASPFIWLAIVWSGTFFVFGFAGLASVRPEGEEKP